MGVVCQRGRIAIRRYGVWFVLDVVWGIVGGRMAIRPMVLLDFFVLW